MSEVAQAPAAGPAATPAVAPASPAAPERPAEGAPQAAQNNAEQAPASQGDEKKPDKNTEQAPEKREGKSRYERRLDKAYKRAAEASARAEFFEKQLNEARVKAQPEDPGAPKLEQFKDIEEYAQAKAKHAEQKALRDHEAKQRAEQAKAHQTKLVSDWEERSAKVEYDDFDEVVGEIKPNTPASVAIMAVENGPDVAYHLGKNLKEAHRIAALPPVMQFIAIGQLAEKLAATPKQPKTPSKAPAPISPLTGAAPVAAKSIYDKDISYNEFVKLRNKQLGRGKAQ